MLNYSVIYSNNRDVIFTFFFTDYVFFRRVLGIFLNYSNYVLPLADFEAKIPCFCLFHVKTMDA